jgi:hypothetical protein
LTKKETSNERGDQFKGKDDATEGGNPFIFNCVPSSLAQNVFARTKSAPPIIDSKISDLQKVEAKKVDRRFLGTEFVSRAGCAVITIAVISGCEVRTSQSDGFDTQKQIEETQVERAKGSPVQIRTPQPPDAHALNSVGELAPVSTEHLGLTKEA